MKNHVKGFSQFINEKADWFEHSDDAAFQYTPQGRWRERNSKEIGEPDEEIDHDEFMQRYGEEMPKSGRDYFGKFGKGRVKVWKEKEPTAESPIEHMSTPELMELKAKLETKLDELSPNSRLAKKVMTTLDMIAAERERR